MASTVGLRRKWGRCPSCARTSATGMLVGWASVAIGVLAAFPTIVILPLALVAAAMTIVFVAHLGAYAVRLTTALGAWRAAPERLPERARMALQEPTWRLVFRFTAKFGIAALPGSSVILRGRPKGRNRVA